MSVTELRTWAITCDRCSRLHSVVTQQHSPSLPADWTYRSVHDCGMTGYTRHDVLCPECADRAAQREADRAKSEAGS